MVMAINNDLFQNHDDSGKSSKMNLNDVNQYTRGLGIAKSARMNQTSKYASNSVGDFQDYEQHGF